jgi:hypothetical protein
MDKLVRLLVTPVLSIKARPILKLLGVSVVLVVTTILFVSFKAPRVSAGPEADRDRDQEEREVRIGFEIAPIPLNMERRHRHLDRRLVGLGSYIVNGQADCNGCHSMGPQTEYLVPGNPYLLPPLNGEQINPATYLGGGRDFGPFGGPNHELKHLYSRNLTPDKTGRPAGGLTWEHFLTIMRTGKNYDTDVHPNCPAGTPATGNADGTCLLPPFNGEVLQVMPWPVHQKMTEHDLRAIYEYLSAVQCIDTVIPNSTDPGALELRNDCE